MKERLQKILSARGVCSRRKAEEYLSEGRITVDGKVAGLGDSADPEFQVIALDGKPIPSPAQPVYIMLHKPRGFVTTLSDEKGRPNVTQLVDCGTRVYPAGRLDMDSEGLLLLTNDGAFAKAMTHPSHQIEKTYQVWVRGYTPGGEKRLERPITLDGYTIRPPKVRLLQTQGTAAFLMITIHEGRNRQIRRMCEHAGMQVTRLRRIAEGKLSLGDLKKGCWRYLTQEELANLKK